MLPIGVPLNMGLVGHPFVHGTTTYSLREDTNLASYLASVAPSPLLEMASHSFQSLPYADKTITWIETDLNSSKRENEFVTGMCCVVLCCVVFLCFKLYECLWTVLFLCVLLCCCAAYIYIGSTGILDGFIVYLVLCVEFMFLMNSSYLF